MSAAPENLWQSRLEKKNKVESFAKELPPEISENTACFMGSITRPQPNSVPPIFGNPTHGFRSKQ